MLPDPPQTSESTTPNSTNRACSTTHVLNRRKFMELTFPAVTFAAGCLNTSDASAGSQPARFRRNVVVSQSSIASRVGASVLNDGGNAIDAAIATAFALAVTHPTAGNIGGGGFLVFRPSSGDPAAFDFRERAPAGAHANMFLNAGKYDSDIHHQSHLAVGVPGTVAGLHRSWQEFGKLPWKRLVEPAVQLANDGFIISIGLARSLAGVLGRMKPYPASVAQFSRNGTPFEPGDILKQSDLAKTLGRIADLGPAGFYEGETALLIEKEMKANGGLITREDLKSYQAKRRIPLKGVYREFELIGMPPVSSGGVAVIQALNILEGYDMRAPGWGSARALHLIAEAARRVFADRARYLGDPDFTSIPVDRLISKSYAADLRKSIKLNRASVSSTTSFEWSYESGETTHLSVVDEQRNAVALTYTLEYGYGSAITVPGAGFLLNNEMGDFNAGPNLTTVDGLIGTQPNLAQPGKRMLSSMSPTIVTKNGKLSMVTGSPGGRTIINTVIQTILNTVDFGMNAQEAVDAARIHHQWLPDKIVYERFGFSPDTLAILKGFGHEMQESRNQGVAEVIVADESSNILEAGVDRRAPDGDAAGT